MDKMRAVKKAHLAATILFSLLMAYAYAKVISQYPKVCPPGVWCPTDPIVYWMVGSAMLLLALGLLTGIIYLLKRQGRRLFLLSLANTTPVLFFLCLAAIFGILHVEHIGDDAMIVLIVITAALNIAYAAYLWKNKAWENNKPGSNKS